MKWSLLSTIEISEMCNSIGCEINDFTENSLIESSDGQYVLSYSATMNNDSSRNIYVIKSDDLINWSEPYQASNYPSYNGASKIIQLVDGSFLMAYVSYENNAIVITSSDNGETWIESQKININANLSTNISFIQNTEKIRIFYTSNNNFYSHTLDEIGQFTNRQLIRQGLPFGPIVVNLQNGELGIVFSLDLNYKRDVFFENIGTIDD
jgi:hypothetical protein